MADPFDTVKSEVQESLGIARALSQRYQEIIQGPSTLDDDELLWTRKEFEKMCRRIDYDVQDLEETIAVVERNPGRWTHVDEDDMRQRKNFVANTKREMLQMKDSVTGKKAEALVQSRKRDLLMRDNIGGGGGSSGGRVHVRDKYAKLDDDIAQDNAEFINQQLLLQNDIIRQQDDHMDDAIQAVGRIKHITLDMHDELDDQDRNIRKLSREVDGLQGLLSRTRKRLDKLLKSGKDRGKLITIVILIVILCALVVVLFSVRF